MFTYSLCMIVKNEERVLRRCLDSYARLFDEVIIVDTGSLDSTKEIAAEYTDKIFDFEWMDDFSEARNFAFSKCSCDYIFSADADEVLDEKNQNELSLLMQAMDGAVEIVQMKYVEEDSAVLNVKKEYRPKLFKRLRIFTWQDAVHEGVRLSPIVFDSDIEIQHKPTGTHEKRDFSIFKRAFSKGERQSANMYEMYAKELFRCAEAEDFSDARDAFLKRLEMKDIDERAYCIAACVLVRSYRLSGDFKSFFKYAMRPFMPQYYSAEMYFELGEYYRNEGDYGEAERYYGRATQTEAVIDIHYSGDLPLFGLAECARKRGELDEVERYSTLARSFELPEGD